MSDLGALSRSVFLRVEETGVQGEAGACIAQDTGAKRRVGVLGTLGSAPEAALRTMRVFFGHVHKALPGPHVPFPLHRRRGRTTRSSARERKAGRGSASGAVPWDFSQQWHGQHTVLGRDMSPDTSSPSLAVSQAEAETDSRGSCQYFWKPSDAGDHIPDLTLHEQGDKEERSDGR